MDHHQVGRLLGTELHALRRDADRLESDPGADDVGQATLSLIRALIASVITDDHTRRAIGDETLLIRVLAYVRAHLTDADLTPARIAAVHNISLRSLYRLCEDGGLSREQWIIRRRLEGARRDLTAPEHTHRTIDAIARSWGFTSPAHFTRHFRRAFGTTPRAWRATVSDLGPTAASTRRGGGERSISRRGYRRDPIDNLYFTYMKTRFRPAAHRSPSGKARR
ncbi:hypothetical protein Misp01_23650 [Microtetraspora sp. NBRC 13810]|uniref:helix-turn-helix domain-containing protein n=1 Tax=Microtetraspora sp. NBRC 13810 TaxID=3030990 RepID=UPI0024A34BEE|nr:helix-turn-helix domain-containing protein [Microtetraspora sp. NBRC 13810]GLW07235.1 hypothetical protein Misp01_23650 [Microtetraspora sp. NBRC 13810]